MYVRRRKLAGEIMDALHCHYDPSQVGMFLWGRIPDTYADVEDLTEKVLHEARVFITPGFIFGSNGKCRERLPFVVCAHGSRPADSSAHRYITFYHIACSLNLTGTI